MSEIIFRGTVVESGKSMLIGFSIAFGIAGAIYCFIGLIAGDRAPSGMPESLPYVGGITAMLLIFGLWRHYRVRGDLFVTKGKNNAYGVTILGPGKKKIVEFFTPFQVTAGWDMVPMGGGKRFYFLHMVFRDENGKCLLSLESQRSGIYGTPDGWKQRTREQMGEMTNSYSCSHMSELSKALRTLVK